MGDIAKMAIQEWLEDDMRRISHGMSGWPWLPGLEYGLWQAVCNLPHDYEYGVSRVPAYQLRKLLYASEWLGGWIASDSSGQKRFVPWDEWNVLYARWKAENGVEASSKGDSEKAVDMVRMIAGLMNGKINSSSNAIASQGSLLTVLMEDSGDAYELLKALDECRELAMSMREERPRELKDSITPSEYRSPRVIVVDDFGDDLSFGELNSTDEVVDADISGEILLAIEERVRHGRNAGSVFADGVEYAFVVNRRKT